MKGKGFDGLVDVFRARGGELLFERGGQIAAERVELRDRNEQRRALAGEFAQSKRGVAQLAEGGLERRLHGFGLAGGRQGAFERGGGGEGVPVGLGGREGFGAGFGEDEADIHREAAAQVARVGNVKPVAPLDGLRRGEKQFGAIGNSRRPGGQRHLDGAAGRRLEDAPSVGEQDFFDRETEGACFAGQLDLEAVVDFEIERGAELDEVASGVLDAADRRSAVPGGVRIDDVAVGSGLQIEPGPRAREDGAQVVGALFLLAGAEGPIEELAVVVDGGGDIERRLLAALDLERGHAGLRKVVDGRAAGEILHGEDKAGADGCRAGRAGGAEGIAAGIGAGAAVSGAVAQERGVEAEARIGVAQRAMQEDLDFAGGLPGDGADFVEREFAGEGDAPEAEARGGADAFEIVDRHLRGGVEAQRRENAGGRGGPRRNPAR